MDSIKNDKSYKNYCLICKHYDENFGVCTKIHENVSNYPKKFLKKCNGSYFEKDSQKVTKNILDEQQYVKSDEKQKYVGIDGWLLFFIFSLLILNPLRILFIIYYYYNEVIISYDYSFMRIFTFFSIVILSIILFYCIYSGYHLLRLKSPRAVKITKSFLKKVLIYSTSTIVIYNVVHNYFDIPGDLREGIEIIISNNIYGVFYPSIWLFYLSVSKRVENTYLKNEENEVNDQ